MYNVVGYVDYNYVVAERLCSSSSIEYNIPAAILVAVSHQRENYYTLCLM